MSMCERLSHEAMKSESGSSAWQLWQSHGESCPQCQKDQAVWRQLQAMANQPANDAERLGAARTQALRDALASQKRPKPFAWKLRFLAVAGLAAILILALLNTPANEPFTVANSPTRWAQIAANPDWDLKAEHPLRARIQSLRDDFRSEKSLPTNSVENKQLKERLQRFRETLATEF